MNKFQYRFSYLVLFFMIWSQLYAETAYKNIQQIQRGSKPHMVGDGFQVQTYFPSSKLNWSSTTPFVLLDYGAPKRFPPTSKQRGVGPHPHRGFETVTFVFDGAVAHRDSSGNGGVIQAGDVQWMTAGSGVLHEEYHENEFARKGGTMHAVQLWVNLPSKDKMTPPKYQTIRNGDMGVVKIDDKGSFARVIAGNLGNVKGPAQTHTPMQVFDLKLKKGVQYTFELPENDHSMMLVTEGAVKVNGRMKADFKDLVVFGTAGSVIKVQALKETRLLVLSGEPIMEPAVQEGPFVMNNREQIQQAWNDLRSGKFGTL